MIQFIISYLWHGLVGWIGITGIVLAASVYIFVTVPSAGIRHACIVTATVCACILFLYPKAFLDGAHHVTAKVLVKEQKLREAGEHARADALADAAGGVLDPWDSDAK